MRACIAVLVCTVAACGLSVDEPGNRPPPSDAEPTTRISPPEPVRCPDGPPKIGEACPPGFVDTESCTYEVAPCPGPAAARLAETVIYCCVSGVWLTCGGDACEVAPPDAAVPDAPPADQPDARVLDVGADAGADAALDAGAEAGADTGVGPGADAA